MVALRIYISHASNESAFAARLANDLRQAGADVRLDAAHLTGPGDFTAHMTQALSDRDVLLLVLSPAAIASQWAPAELNAAIVRANQGLMRPPLIAHGAPVALAQIAGIWTLYQRIDLASDYAAALPHLLVALGLAATATPGMPVSPAPAQPSFEPPASPVVPVAAPPVPAAPPMPYAPPAMYGGPDPQGYYQAPYRPPLPPQPPQPAVKSAPVPTTIVTMLLFSVMLAGIVIIVNLLMSLLVAVSFRVPPVRELVFSVLEFHAGVFYVQSVLIYLIAALVAFFSGWRIVSRSGSMAGSVLAGIGIALVGLLVSDIVSGLITYLIYFRFMPILAYFSIAGILRFVAIGTVFGVIAGTLGGLAGRSRAQATP